MAFLVGRIYASSMQNTQIGFNALNAINTHYIYMKYVSVITFEIYVGRL